MSVTRKRRDAVVWWMANVPELQDTPNVEWAAQLRKQGRRQETVFLVLGVLAGVLSVVTLVSLLRLLWTMPNG